MLVSLYDGYNIALRTFFTVLLDVVPWLSVCGRGLFLRVCEDKVKEEKSIRGRLNS